MESNNHIDKLFKGVLKNFEAEPINDIWAGIEERLNNESTPPSRSNLLQYAAALFLFLSLCLASVPLVKKSDSTTATAGFDLPISSDELSISLTIEAEPLYQASASELIEEKPVAEITKPERDDLMAMVDQQSIETVIPTAISSNDEEFIFVPLEDVESIDNRRNAILLDREFNADLPMNAFSAGRTEEKHDRYIVEERTIDDDYMKIDLRGWYVGVNGSYNQTSLLEYGNIYRGERAIQPSLKFGTSKGVTLGYNFNNHFGLQFDYVYNATLGQNYVTSDEEVVTEKTLALNYDQFTLTSRFKQARFSDLTEQPVVVNYSIGVQYGSLRDFRLPQEKRWDTTEDLFKDYDYSLVIGLDYELYIQDNLFVTIGGRGTIGSDISQHNEPLDDYAKRNFVFGVRGGLNYVFR